jgi:hypothetical protein
VSGVEGGSAAAPFIPKRRDTSRMSDATTGEGSVGPAAVGGIAAVVTFGMLAYVTVLLFDRIAVGIVVGALSGAGIFYTVPYTIQRDDPGYARDAHPNLARSFHPGAAGYALSGAGVVALSLLFVFETPLLPVGVALSLALVEYVVLSRVLPRAGEGTDADDGVEWSSDDWDDNR